MPKKALCTYTLLALTACFLSYKLGSAPTALASRSLSPQSGTEEVTPTLPTAPGTWALTATQTVEGASAGVTKAAGGAGVKHVATCVSASIQSFNNGGLTDTSTLQLKDGPNTVVQQWYVTVVDGPKGAGAFLFSQCNLNIVGSPNTSMILQLNGSTYWLTNVSLVGYDAM